MHKKDMREAKLRCCQCIEGKKQILCAVEVNNFFSVILKIVSKVDQRLWVKIEIVRDKNATECYLRLLETSGKKCIIV